MLTPAAAEESSAMRITWSDLQRDMAAGLQGRRIEIEGWFAATGPADTYAGFFLTDEPVCCFGCLPRDPARCIAVVAARPVAPASQHLRLSGIWHILQDRDGRVGQLLDARIETPVAPVLAAPGFTRRAAMAGGLAAGLAAWMPARPATAATDAGSLAAARQLLASRVTVDLHSHGGTVITSRQGRPRAFTPLAAPMREGGMAVICLAVVADRPATRVEEHRIRPWREPAPGELYAYSHDAFRRLHDLVRHEELGVITDAAGLKAATADAPAVIVSSEGADFLEGNPDRIDEAYQRWHLRHLQLTHYRVNELGDIQTEPPVHGGLTEAGVAAIRRCNRLGVVVDVAHGTYALVKRAAAVTEKPLVLSHTSLNPKPSRYSRTISPDHARIIAETGGVIGIWPPTTIFPDLAALAEGMARMVEVAGIDHVGLGSDTMGLLSPAALASYADLPGLAAALLAHGFSADETARLLGGNYARVFAATMA